MHKRSRGKHRWGIEASFPLVASNGITVMRDRRSLIDRCPENISMEDRLTILFVMPPPGKRA